MRVRVAIIILLVILIAYMAYRYFIEAPKKDPYYMKASDQYINWLRIKERFSPQPYNDPSWQTAKKSIGYGHQIKPGEEWMLKGISTSQGEDILKKDLVSREATVAQVIKVPLTQGQFDALLDFEYNTGALRTATLSKVINNKGSILEIEKEWLRWVYSAGKKVEGLLNRRKENLLMYKYGIYST
jgi:GH24 family phage-related lysozyme (muramidase)